jgi:hypothetical protein
MASPFTIGRKKAASGERSRCKGCLHLCANRLEFQELFSAVIHARSPKIHLQLKLTTENLYCMNTRILIALSVAFLLTPALSPLIAVEHPKSLPQTTQFSQLPQNQTRPVEKEVSQADISTGIKKDIARTSKKSSDKKFHTEYKGKDLALDLIKVHDDQLSSLGKGRYFACVDMKAADGTAYDIDFLVAGKPGAMKVTETFVHKVNGKPLYNWKEEGGVWRKVAKS